MNVSYNTTSNKAMNTIDHTFADATTDGKGKNYPIQMYGGSSNSPNQPAYGLDTPSPPMTAVPSRPVSNNSNIMASSSLTMPQYPSQLSQSQHQQSDQAIQAQHARQHRQAESSTLSQQQLRLQRQQQQQQGQLQQQHQAQLQQLQQHQQLQQNPYQNHQQQHDMRQIAGQQNAKQYEKHQQQQQRASAQQVFDFHDPSLTGNHYQDHSRTMPNRQSVNSPSSGQVSHDRMRQSANTYTNDETSVQDPQLRHLHHLQSQQQQQQQQHQQQNPQNQHQQHPQQHRQFGHHSHQIQLEQPNRDFSDGVVHDPRLQGSLNHDQRGLQAMSEASFSPSHMQTQAQLNQMSPGLTDGVHLQHSQQVTSSKTGDQTITIITKMVAATDEDGSKKKRGRPKKLILDPATNQYIDSSHQNFKKLNKLLKQSTDITVKQANSSMENGIKLASLNDQEMKQLLESKDRRGRPRKFPVEQTGITIKGVRMSGTMKVKKKAPAVSLDPSGKVEKKKRGRPKRDATAAVKIV